MIFAALPGSEHHRLHYNASKASFILKSSASSDSHTIFFADFPNDPTWIPSGETIGRDVACHNTSCTDHTALSDRDTTTDNYIRSQPAIILDRDRLRLFKIINTAVFSRPHITFFR